MSRKKGPQSAWRRRLARQLRAAAQGRPPVGPRSDRRDAARTFVIVDAGVVIGYHALLAGQLDYRSGDRTNPQGHVAPLPITVAGLARLAVDHDQNRGVGATLLRDALRKALAAEQLAVRAAVVHAIDEPAVRRRRSALAADAAAVRQRDRALGPMRPDSNGHL